MRIAILYSGFLRNWKGLLNDNLSYLFTEETDLYFYTYDAPPDVTPKQLIHIPTGQKDDDVYYDLAYYERVKDKHPDNAYMKLRAYGGGHANVLNQWHNNFIGFCTVPNDYDVYVRSRGDVRLHSKIDFHSYEYIDNRLYSTTAIDWGGLNDQFAFGNYKTMKIYYSLYVEYLRKNGYLNPYYPEHSLLWHLQEFNVEIVKIKVEHTLER